MHNTPAPPAPRNIHHTLHAIQRKLVATKNKRNDFGGYQYRNKEGILEAVKPLLDELCATLTIQDDLEQIGDRHYIRAIATLTAEDGSTISTSSYAREAATKKGMDEAQITGATCSYAGKYALCNLFAIDDSADDPDATNDNEKRLPTPAELVRICSCETVEELKDTFRSLIAKDCAKGYIADLCAYRKGQLLQTQPQREDLYPEENTPAPQQTAYHD